MKHYRLNQIAMAVLGALLLFFGTRTLIDILYQEHEPEKPGLEVAGTEEKPKTEGEKPSGGAEVPEVLALLATADPAKGEQDAALCKVCHSFDKGGGALIGPPLYGVLGRKIASVEGFNYSPALKAKQSEGAWDYAHVDAFITNPQAYAPGTMMAFPGVADVKKRADILAFLRTKNDNPPPLPEAAPAAAPAEKATEEPKATEPEPAAPAEEKTEPSEPPAAAEPEKPAPAEEPKATEPEPAAPAEEKTQPSAPPAAAEPEKPAPTEEAPAAEPEPPAAEPEAPAAEPEAPAAEPEAPAAEEPAAEEPAAEEPAPAEATEPSASGEESNSAWPQPVYPAEPTEPAEGAAPPASETSPSASEAPSASSEESNPAWPQPVYPDGSPN